MAIMRSTRTDESVCPDCVAGLDHCHGTLVDHHDGAPECTEPRCAALDPARHSLRLDCAELPGCDCTPDYAEWLTLAS